MKELVVQDWIGVAALAVAMLALTVMMFKTRRRIIDNKDDTGQSDRARSEAQIVRRELDQLLIDIEEMCRDVTARLDTKMRVLNELIVQADDRIKMIQSLGHDKTESDAKPEQTGSGKAQHNVSEKDSSGIDRQPGEPAAGKAESTPDTGEKPFDADPRFSRIFEMADAGADIVEIAKETGMPKGEIKLILGLRSRKDK